MTGHQRVFRKPAESASQLTELLVQRGLTISDLAECQHAIRSIGYYRLTAYMLPFQKRGPSAERHNFISGINFRDILDLYLFDRKLRLLVLDVLERIEVSLRASITDTLAVTHGSHWYCDSKNFRSDFDHPKYLSEIDFEIGRSDPKRRTISIQHYYDTYDSPPVPPSWMIFEALSFGKVAYTIRNISAFERARISRMFNIGEPILHSWCLSLSYVRNIAAHHSRFWNRNFTIKPMISSVFKDDLAPNHTCYSQLVTMQVLMRSISPLSRWQDKLSTLLLDHPKIDPGHLGFPPNWKLRSLWR